MISTGQFKLRGEYISKKLNYWHNDCRENL
jgi:hypothetical protein